VLQHACTIKVANSYSYRALWLHGFDQHHLFFFIGNKVNSGCKVGLFDLPTATRASTCSFGTLGIEHTAFHSLPPRI
jgi:hypothetical protein